MSVASIYNIPLSSEELLSWSFAHMAHHRDVIAYIDRVHGIQLPEYSLDPMPVDDLGTWALQHNAMHQSQDEILGVAGFDLTELDLGNQEAFTGWVHLNADLHYLESAATGVG